MELGIGYISSNLFQSLPIAVRVGRVRALGVLNATGRSVMPEGTTVEYKREYNEKVNNTLLAFLNTEGGELYLGLSDDGSVYGLEEDPDILARKVATSFRDSVIPDPSAYMRIEPEFRDAKSIIKVSVERGSATPYCFSRFGLTPKGVYIRIGSNTVMATNEHIRHMIKDTSGGHFLEELSFNQDLTFDYAEQTFQGKKIDFGKEQKQTLGLIRSDGRYSNLALILSDQCPYSTKAAIFEGTNKTYFKDRKIFAGSLFKQIDDTLEYLNVYNRVHATFEGAYRIDHPDYPGTAFREAYVNALIHRDYYIEGSVLVSMFDDRVEIMSLGGALPGVTYSLMLSGVSVPRNEKLAQIFYRLEIIEAFGTGIPRIFESYEGQDKKPEIPIIDGGFLIQLPNVNYKQPQADAGNNREVKRSAEALLYVAFENSSFTKKDAAEILDISPNGAYKHLKRMEEQGTLNSERVGKELRYTFP